MIEFYFSPEKNKTSFQNSISNNWIYPEDFATAQNFLFGLIEI